MNRFRTLLCAAAVVLASAASAYAAPTVTFQRVSHSNTTPLVIEIANATISGTYATGGFTWTPTSIAGTPGSSPLPYSKVRTVQFVSPNGYIYVTTLTQSGFGVSATTKVYSAPGTELTNGTTMPDATATVILYLGL